MDPRSFWIRGTTQKVTASGVGVIGLSETCRLSGLEALKESQLQLELHSLLCEEEIHWKQRSGITWLQEEDSNTKFFHLIANSRLNKTSFLESAIMGFG